MAITLPGASNGSIDFGDLAALAGVTELSVAVTFLASSIADNERICGQWGSSAANRGFLVQVTDTDEIGFVLDGGGASTFFGRKTSGLNLVTGTRYRMLLTFSATGPTIAIYVNGSAQGSLAEFVDSDAVAAMRDSNASVQVGHESASGTDGIDADFSEFALWSRALSADEAIAYTKGFSPAHLRRGGILYSRLLNTADLVDRWGGVSPSNTAGTTAAHPPVFYRRTRRQRAFVPGEVVVGGDPEGPLVGGKLVGRGILGGRLVA